MTATSAQVNYYTSQWEKSNGSPSNFLARITHNPEFNKLTEKEQNFLKGKDDTGYTTRLEGMLMDSARDILVASGKKPTTAETKNLASKLIKGSDTSSDDGYTFKDLVTDLSTTTSPIRPGQNRGGAGAGAQATVANVLSALDGLARKLNSFNIPGKTYGQSTVD